MDSRGRSASHLHACPINEKGNSLNRNDSCEIFLNENADHSASLVRIADQLSDSPFGVVHHRLAPAFSIVVLWVIGRHGTASRNFSVMRRLLPFSADLIISFRA
uniref:Uncharacterized protein n=1 Tax=Solanum tuberosum TaxID=4113 RepID=M1D8Q0_SOLTU